MNSTTGLVMSNITHHFGRTQVVDDVSLSIAPGELLCLLGPSGCGKTTTLRIAAGLEVPSAGTVVLNGTEVSGPHAQLPPESRHVGFLFQDYALFPHLRVRGNVEFGLAGKPAAERRARAEEMLDQVGMADYAESWPHQLSGGQQQRVALARALAPNPGLMLLDEPFSGLDKRLRDQVRDETLHVLKRNRVSTLMVTHDPEEAMFMADRVAVMRQGRIVQMDQPQTLYNQPADPFVASFFGEVNVFDAAIADGMAQTPLGPFAASLNGAGKAQVLIRPEGISLDPAGGAEGIVLAARLLGRVSLVHLRVEHPTLPAHHLHARLASRALPAEGERIRITVDPSQVFIFPAA
ncbi:ABC transporter ATP-binding protein [Magnetospirillum sulfuroxidans]|uniref:ABC transporter ATP-binding protein n=1 Tax=Magnetospirillum sulfuroxidans TaxID=611300 RepID=A0ABS5I6T9_9PROT|nr:ABC transporter ATP-binding protein [Magnetospirillum sulfuroxidans]MBR9970138.1 ABC transporter ATP-binding protein [Magnetospirillum sulfuroxidans]